MFALGIVHYDLDAFNEGRRVLSSLWWVIEELAPDGLWERVAPLVSVRPALAAVGDG
jgi:hypothetical protein